MVPRNEGPLENSVPEVYYMYSRFQSLAKLSIMNGSMYAMYWSLERFLNSIYIHVQVSQMQRILPLNSIVSMLFYGRKIQYRLQYFKSKQGINASKMEKYKSLHCSVIFIPFLLQDQFVNFSNTVKCSVNVESVIWDLCSKIYNQLL